MEVRNQVYPTSDQFAALAETAELGTVAMLNLVKFRGDAGRAAYMRYAETMKKIVEREGGRFVYVGDVKALVVGEVEDLWDAVAVVEYPSGAVLHRIVASPEYQAIEADREAGLVGQLLMLTTAQAIG